jgi:iron(III) transport system substrate-binding protein
LAKKEGKFVITTFDQGDRAAVQRFSQTFTDIRVEAQVLTGRDFTVRVPEERRAGIFSYDIYMSGPTSAITNIIPQGERRGDPVLGDTRSLLVRPEVVDDRNWIGGLDDWWADNLTKRTLFHTRGTPGGTSLQVNRQKLPAEKFNKLEDLFKPEMRGKWCSSDMRGPGPGSTFFAQTVAVRGPEFVRRLYTESGLVMGSDRRKMAEDLIRGDYWACVGPDIDPFLEQGVGLHVEQANLEKGAPIVPEYQGKIRITCCGTGKNQSVIEGFYATGSGGPAIVTKAPHPNAAKIFLNWFLSREGQLAFQAPLYRECSPRVDMQEKCPRKPLLEEGKGYIDFQNTTNAQYKQLVQDMALQVFGR